MIKKEAKKTKEKCNAYVYNNAWGKYTVTIKIKQIQDSKDSSADKNV